MDTRPIGMFDSGIGGLTVLKEVKRLLPNEDFLYYGDSINNPYGEKSDEELMVITTKIVNYLKENDIEIPVSKGQDKFINKTVEKNK